MVQANLLDFCVVAESYRSEKRSREIEDRSERDRDPGLITRGDKIPDQMDLKRKDRRQKTDLEFYFRKIAINCVD